MLHVSQRTSPHSRTSAPVGTITANHSSLGGNEDRNFKKNNSGDDLPNNLDMETTSNNATFPPDAIVNDRAPTNYTAAHAL